MLFNTESAAKGVFHSSKDFSLYLAILLMAWHFCILMSCCRSWVKVKSPIYLMLLECWFKFWVMLILCERQNVLNLIVSDAGFCFGKS